MEYKILVKTNNGLNTADYYKFYQVSSAEGDWKSTDKEETIEKIKELFEIYSLSEMKLVIGVDIDITMDIPELPVTSDGEEDEEPTEENPEETPEENTKEDGEDTGISEDNQ